MDVQRAQAIAQEADELLKEDPHHFESPGFNQPAGDYVDMAEGFLGALSDGAPWHQVAHLAHMIKSEEEAAEEEGALA